MKTFILTSALLLSLPSFAKVPEGIFQVDSSESQVNISGELKPLKGLIDIAEEFSESKFRLETGEGLFISRSVTGNLSDFEVKGFVSHNGTIKDVSFRGTFLGTIEQEENYEKIVLKLESEEYKGSVFAQKPKIAAAELHQKVREIIR